MARNLLRHSLILIHGGQRSPRSFYCQATQALWAGLAPLQACTGRHIG